MSLHNLHSSVRTSGVLPLEFIRDFLFDLENGTLLHPSRPFATSCNDLSSGALPTVCRPHQHSPNCPICGLLLHTGPLSTYPVGIGSSAIRPSMAPNRRRFRCPSASRARSTTSYFSGRRGTQCRVGQGEARRIASQLRACAERSPCRI